MSNGLKSRVEDLKASFDRMSSRERRMVGALGAIFAFLIVFGIAYYVSSGLDELHEGNAKLRKALKKITAKQSVYMAQRRRIAALETRMSHSGLELNSYVEKAASAVGVTVAESRPIDAVPGDRYTRRGMEIKLHKVTISQLTALIKRLEEEQAHIVQVTKLNVSTRWNRNQELDVDMVISTFDRRRGQRPAARGRS